MSSENCDIAVIGAGPAGSRVAVLAASDGLEVILLEKRERIGYPVRCAEAMGPRDEVERYISLDQSLIESSIHGVEVISPGGEIFQFNMDNMGLITDRELFDRALARRAEEEGADVRTGHQAVKLLRRNGSINGLRVKQVNSGGEYDIRCQVVVGADGVEALSPRWAGIAESFRPGEVFSCAQQLIQTDSPTPPVIEFHLGRDIAPGSYGWIFPKRGSTANMGVGINPLMAGKVKASGYLERFLKKARPAADKKRTVLGCCEVSRGLTDLITDGYVAVGEAARQNNPFSGGGIINSLEAADMAAPVLIEAIRRGDISARALRPYQEEWRRSTGRTNRIFYQAAQIFYQLSDRDMDMIISKVAGRRGIAYKKGLRPVRFIASILLSRPGLIFKLLGSMFRG